MQTYRCPVCKKLLTKREYESALGILQAREVHLKHREAEIRKREAEFRKTKAELRARARIAKREGLDEGKRKERERVGRLMAGQKKRIDTLRERVRQLKQGTTPQTEGLEFEGTLVQRLRREFPADRIRHEGKTGDILQFVSFAHREIGLILYECKRTPSIPTAHLQQASSAKQAREADYAVLVTTGKRKGFTGFAEAGGVLIVAPLGVPALAHLLRATLIEMFKARIAKGKRAQIATKLLSFVAGPQFRNPIQEVITRTAQLRGMLMDEAKQHQRVWTQRWQHYQLMSWDASTIQENIQLVLSGKEPESLPPPKPGVPPLLPPGSVSKSQT